jgi:hypothetical protein
LLLRVFVRRQWSVGSGLLLRLAGMSDKSVLSTQY